MTKRNWKQLLLLLILGSVLAKAAAAQSTPEFRQLLDEAGLLLDAKPAFIELPVQHNEIFNYELALRHTTKPLEIRLAVRPLKRLEISYQDPHNAAPEPNHIFPLIFDSLVGQLGKSGPMPSREYPQEQAQRLFNADWAAAALVDIEPGFTSDYRQALIIAVHRNNQADAYTIFLFDDYAPVKQLINENLAVMKFVTPP